MDCHCHRCGPCVPWVGQGELIKDGVPGGLAVVRPLLQTCDGVSALGVIQHDLLGIGVVPAASQVDVVQEEVINSSLDHLQEGGEGELEVAHTVARDYTVNHIRKPVVVVVHTMHLC